ncbi:MAG: ABC transporter permease [Bacteroidales bacterium]|nr:ABC transporter permease [Bacteroidales bacterium]
MKGLESVAMAARNLGRERFRAVLSLAGVSVGIFCIVASMTLFESLHRSLREGMEAFGAEAVFIEKVPLEPDLDESGTFRWWKYLERQEPSYREFLFLRERASLAGEMTFSACYNDGKVIAVTEGWRSVVPNQLASGRGFSRRELSGGAAVAIAGASVDLGRDKGYIEVGGVRIPVIGTLKAGGVNAVGLVGDIDNAVLVPFMWAVNAQNLTPGKRTITAFPSPGVSESALKEELSRLLRGFHRTLPGGDDGFAINSMSFIASEVGSLFSTIGYVGWIIGLFSLLIGGFGIANIMFVGVAERTREIGLQKALGAARRAILTQYLAEASLLSAAGAFSGILLVMLICKLVPSSVVELSVSAATAAAAIAAALALGIASGLAPAIRAASLPPAEALSK